jgi:hypothetical protein
LEERQRAMRQEVKRQLSDSLVSQEIEVKGAEAEYENARLGRQVAEIHVTEYLRGIFPREEENLRGDVKLAEHELAFVKDRIKGSTLPADQLALQLAEFNLQGAQTKLKVLTEYEKERKLLELRAEVEKARSDELMAMAKRDRAKATESFFRKQVAKYHAIAPEDMVLALLDDAVQLEERVVSHLADAAKLADRAKLDPAGARALTDKLKEKRAEAQKAADEARFLLTHGIELAERVSALRAKLRDGEAELKDVRQSLETLEEALRIPPQYRGS